MKRLTLIVLALMCLLPVLAAAQPPSEPPPPLQYRFDLVEQFGPRYLGSQDIGVVRLHEFYFSALNPATHASPLTFQIDAYDNTIDANSSITLPERSFALGAMVPIKTWGGIRAGATESTFLNDDPFHAFGIYPFAATAVGDLELGYEYDTQDLKHRTFGYATLYRRLGEGKLLFGASNERYDVQAATLTNVNEQRFGTGYLTNIRSANLQVLVSGNYNVDSKKPTWVLGLSRYAATDHGGLNPGITLTYRHKPESTYGLGIIALGGRSVNEHACRAINEAFFSGALTHSRLVGNRNYDTPLIGSSYEAKDYGVFVLAVSVLSVNAGKTAKLVSRDVSWYATYPRAFGLMRDPYIGATWNEFSDLIYDAGAHRLADPVQRFWEFKAGWKIRLHKRVDRRNQLGQLRLNAKVNTHGGWSVKATSWF